MLLNNIAPNLKCGDKFFAHYENKMHQVIVTDGNQYIAQGMYFFPCKVGGESEELYIGFIIGDDENDLIQGKLIRRPYINPNGYFGFYSNPCFSDVLALTLYKSVNDFANGCKMSWTDINTFTPKVKDIISCGDMSISAKGDEGHCRITPQFFYANKGSNYINFVKFVNDKCWCLKCVNSGDVRVFYPILRDKYGDGETFASREDCWKHIVETMEIEYCDGEMPQQKPTLENELTEWTNKHQLMSSELLSILRKHNVL